MSRHENRGFRSLFFPNSLRSQLLYRSLLILALLLMLVGLLQYVFMRDVVYKNKAASIQSQILSISSGTWFELGTGGQPVFFIPGSNLAFVDVKGNYSVLSSGPDGLNPPRLNTRDYLALFLKKPGLNYKVVTDGGVQQLLVLQPISSGPGQFLGIVQVGTPTIQLKELLFRQLLTFLLLSLSALLFGLLAFLPVLKRTLVPLFNMIKTAEQIDAGNLDKRFPARQGQLEIDRLSESFNSMLERLEGSFETERETKEQMRRFIADASHELRTPLTSIRGFLDVLLRGAAHQPDQLNKSLKSMQSESERLNKLVQDLIILARLERTPHIELAQGMLDAVIREMEPQLMILSGKRKLSLSMEPNMACKYDIDKIKQVILNLFHNAVQHTDPERGQIKISLTGKNNGVLLAIQDNGPGISKAHLPYIFDRFYRSDSARTRKYGGAGLGLSITKSIIEAHGGTIHVASEEGKGSIFEVWLPA
ncbi:sensor histidine kinase [Candidatus Formimonas warabiya]|uniref:histidine kinase n=1 Tax=Formimonas warabiya TaxID=1761012 RepID=A0A3G1KT26_FORW1|nr:HAMP domain-containing sensor histidine kinase [Candidatus Formimonas warabiya]ATW25580.1 two-component sensor histidine kinase [Candidatus Formimonas warabiya]